MADLTLKVGADISKFNEELTKVNRKLDGMGSDLKKVASEMSIGGVTMGRAFAALANPVTAVAAAVGALGTAYAKSTIGAKDLEFAHNQLAIATGLLTNSMAGLISSTEDGGGFFSRLAHGAITYFSPALAGASLALAHMKEEMEDLGRDGTLAMAKFQEALADNQDLLTQINDEQTSWGMQQSLIGQALSNISDKSREVLEIRNRELEILQKQQEADKANEAITDAIAAKVLEIEKYKKLIARQTESLLRLEDNLEKKEAARLAKIQKENLLLKEREAIIRNILNPIKIAGAGLGKVAAPGLLPVDMGFGKVDTGMTGKQLYKFNQEMNAALNDIMLDLGPPLADLGTLFIEGFADAAMGIKDSGAKMVAALGAVMGQFGKMLVAAGIAAQGLKIMIKNPLAAIAAGAALIALSRAVSKKAESMMSNAGTGGRATGGSERFDGRGYVSGNTQDVQVYGRVEVSGQQLAIVLQNYERRNRFTTAGG